MPIRLLLSRMAYLLVKHGSKLDFHHPEFGAELDDESVASFVKRELSQNILNFIAGPLISTLFFYGSEETSKLLYLNLAKHMFNTRMYTIQGGLHRLTQRLAEEATIEKQRQVDGVGVDAGEFVINGRSFSDVVIAVPGNAVLGISGLAEMLDEGDRRFFENCRYGRALTVTFDTARPVDQCYALSIPRVESQRAATIIFHDFIDPDSCCGWRWAYHDRWRRRLYYAAGVAGRLWANLPGCPRFTYSVGLDCGDAQIPTRQVQGTCRISGAST